MMRLLQNWKGSVTVNGVAYASIADVPAMTGTLHITLQPANSTVESDKGMNVPSMESKPEKQVRITVKRYMTQKSEAGFDFMLKFNHNNPMPYRIMTGVKTKETPGMVYMKLHADMWATKMTTCMCCGKVLTNPVSQYFGIGPECGHHNYVNPFGSNEELQQAVAAYRKTLQEVTWEGWIIKSAITEEVEV